MPAKYRISLTVVLTASLLAATLVIAMKAFFSDKTLDVTSYAAIGLVSVVLAGVGERAFRKKQKRLKQIAHKRQKNRKTRQKRK